MYCAFCGNEIPGTGQFCPSCGKGEFSAAFRIPERREPFWVDTLKKIVAAFVILFALAFILRTYEGMAPANRCTSKDSKAVVAVEMALSSWREGRLGGEYWKSNAEQKRLFAVRDFERIAGYELQGKPNASAYTYRIDSSTKAGTPITKNWTFYVVLEGEDCRIADVAEE